MLNMTKFEAARFHHELYRGERCLCCGRPSVLCGTCPQCSDWSRQVTRYRGDGAPEPAGPFNARREIRKRREILNANAGDHRLQSHRRACRITA